ncbi:MAG: polyhydroxyalkanoate granule-associated phasin [Casimicrobiaceae bacterium]
MRRQASGYGAPLSAWFGLGMRVAQMYASSAHVIGHRTQRMMLAGPVPSRRDRAEFARMGSEKVDAAMESSSAMAASLVTLNMRLWTRAMQGSFTTATRAFELASSTTPAQARARHAALLRAISRSSMTPREAALSTAQLIAKGMAPLHSRATANSRRLARR